MDRQRKRNRPTNSDIYLDAVRFYGKRNITVEELRVFASKKYKVNLASRLKSTPGDTNPQDFESVKSRSIKRLEDSLMEAKHDHHQKKLYTIEVSTEGYSSPMSSSCTTSASDDSSESSDEDFDVSMLSDIHWTDFDNQNGAAKPPSKRQRKYSVQILPAGLTYSSSVLSSNISDRQSEESSSSSEDSVSEDDSEEYTNCCGSHENDVPLECSLQIQYGVDRVRPYDETDDADESLTSFTTEDCDDDCTEVTATMKSPVFRRDSLCEDEAMEVEEGLDPKTCAKNPRKSVRFLTPRKHYEEEEPLATTVLFDITAKESPARHNKRSPARKSQSHQGLVKDVYFVTQIHPESPELPNCNISTSLQWISELGGWVKTSKLENPWARNPSEEGDSGSMVNDAHKMMSTTFNLFDDSQRVTQEGINNKEQSEIFDYRGHCWSPNSKPYARAYNDTITDMFVDIDSNYGRKGVSETNVTRVAEGFDVSQEHDSRNAQNYEAGGKVVKVATADVSTSCRSLQSNTCVSFNQSEKTEHKISPHNGYTTVQNTRHEGNQSKSSENLAPTPNSCSFKANPEMVLTIASSKNRSQELQSPLHKEKETTPPTMDSTPSLLVTHMSTKMNVDTVQEERVTVVESSLGEANEFREGVDPAIDMEIDTEPNQQQNLVYSGSSPLNRAAINEEPTPCQPTPNEPELCPSLFRSDEDEHISAHTGRTAENEWEQATEYAQEARSSLTLDQSDTENMQPSIDSKAKCSTREMNRVVAELERIHRMKMDEQTINETLRKDHRPKEESKCVIQ